MSTIGPIVVCMLLWGIAGLGLGLLLSPSRTLPVISKVGLSGVYYDRERGSLLPMWAWRVMGLGFLTLGSFYGLVVSWKLVMRYLLG